MRADQYRTVGGVKTCSLSMPYASLLLSRLRFLPRAVIALCALDTPADSRQSRPNWVRFAIRYRNARSVFCWCVFLFCSSIRRRIASELERLRQGPAKFILPSSFSEQAAAEKYVQHNMWLDQLFGVTVVFWPTPSLVNHYTLYMAFFDIYGLLRRIGFLGCWRLGTPAT